jgi:hypothetical protein
VSNLAEMTNGILKIMAELPKDQMEGELPCPVCKTGTVRWLRVPRNKHLRMGCTTPECILMMQ